ncbi:metallophosphoesterase family protein [Candidatus Woesearchaeota archaeon]|nr:metallophosphoesterase family protein [Candidatus Woesearchaeota archaeon]
MKIYAFTDVHGETKKIDKILSDISVFKPDVLVCCGDLTDFGGDLKKHISRFDLEIPFLILHGNHESIAQIESISGKSIINLHKNFFEFEDYTFLGYGGGGFVQESEDFCDFVENLDIKGKKLVIVTHMPPFKTMLDKLEMGYRGLIPLREFIINKKPALVLSGHLHENAGKVDFIQNTVLINPGGGKLIEI